MDLRRLSVLVLMAVLCPACTLDTESEAGDVPLLTAVESLRIGSVSDEASALTWFPHISIGPNDEIVTLHPQEHLFRIHSAEGQLLATAGRQGEGPGELSGSGPFGIRGDTLWVLDFRTFRISRFLLDGSFVDSKRIHVEMGSGRTDDPPMPRTLLADGTILGHSPLWSDQVATGAITTAIAYRLNEEGEATDSLTSYSVANTTWAIMGDDPARPFGVFGQQPFSDTELVEFSPFSMEMMRVTRVAEPEGPHSFRLELVESGSDTLFSRSYPYDPKPINQDLIGKLVRERGATFENPRFAEIMTRSRAEEVARESLYLPSHHPRVSKVLPGIDGTWWLRHEDEGSGHVEWSGIARDGAELGRAILPEGLEMMAVSREHVWGLMRDELDVPFIVRLDFEGVPR